MSSTFPACLLAATLLIVSGCSSSQVSTSIVPAGATIDHWIPLPYSGRVKLAHYPAGGFALYRSSPENDGSTLLQGYNDTLGLLWSRIGRYDEYSRLLWLGHHSGNVVAAWQPRQEYGYDSISIVAHIYNPLDGAAGDSTLLATMYYGDRTVVPPQILTSADSSRLIAYSVDLPYRGRTGFDSILVRARMVDADLRYKGEIAFNPHVLPFSEGTEVTTRVLGAPVVDSLGRVYMAVVVGTKMLRIHRIDIESASTTALDITTALIFPTIDQNQLRDVVLAVDESGKILVAVSEYGNGNTAAVTLHRLDFERHAVDYSKRFDVAANVFTQPEAEEIDGLLRLRQILPSGVHGNVILLEDVRTDLRPGKTRWTTDDRGISSYDVIREGHVIYWHGAMTVILLDSNGTYRWSAIQKRDPTWWPDPDYRPGIWRMSGDTLHYLFDNVLAGAIEMGAGRIGAPAHLYSTEMDLDQMQSRLIDARSAIVVLGSGSYNSIVAFRF